MLLAYLRILIAAVETLNWLIGLGDDFDTVPIDT